MIHRTKKENDIFKDFWNGIGGKLHHNETPEECIIREVIEETGLTIVKPQLRGIITFPNNRDTSETWIVFVFTATKFSGTVIENHEGTLEWIRTKGIPKLNIQNADRVFMPWLNKKEIFSAKFHYRGDNLIDHIVNFC